MALEQCKTCGGQLSSNAKTCPHCGEKIHRWTTGKRLFAALFTAAVLGGIWNAATSPGAANQGAAATPDPNSPEGKALRSASIALRAWKTTLKNPDSAQVNRVLLMPNGAACIDVRARNSFNAVVPAQMVVSPSGTPTISEGDADDFRAAWDSWCAGNTGTDATSQARAWAGV